MLQVLQGNQDEAAAQQPLQNCLETGIHQPLSFQKNLLTEDRLWLFLKSSFQIQGLSGRLTLINSCTLTITKFFIFC